MANGNFWAKLGSLRRRMTKAGKESSYIVLDKKYSIVSNETGEKVDLGQYLQIKLIDPIPGLQKRLENGSLSEEDYNKQLQFIEEKGIQFELTVPPSESSGY